MPGKCNIALSDRRLPGPLDSTKMVHTPHILKGLGGGDADVAALRLLAMRSEHEEDRDIVAAMASVGYGAEGETVLDRLTAVLSSMLTHALCGAGVTTASKSSPR